MATPSMVIDVLDFFPPFASGPLNALHLQCQYSRVFHAAPRFCIYESNVATLWGAAGPFVQMPGDNSMSRFGLLVRTHSQQAAGLTLKVLIGIDEERRKRCQRSVRCRDNKTPLLFL
jgi:hypothetical protein